MLVQRSSYGLSLRPHSASEQKAAPSLIPGEAAFPCGRKAGSRQNGCMKASSKYMSVEIIMLPIMSQMTTRNQSLDFKKTTPLFRWYGNE